MRRALLASSWIVLGSVAHAQQALGLDARAAPLVESYYRSKGFFHDSDVRNAQQNFVLEDVQGWSVWVAEDLQGDSQLKNQVIDRLAVKLGEARLVLPDQAYERLRAST